MPTTERNQTDLLEKIQTLKKERDAIVLAHYYQEPTIQDLADILGDSLELARVAQTTQAATIVLCGVHFMAETAKILNPDKTVLVPDEDAGCSLAESCTKEALAELKAKHPDHVVVSYVNTTAAIKALSDYACTSSNAVAVVESIPKNQPIIFVPDVNLGNYVKMQTGRDMVLWPGKCMVHEMFKLDCIVDQLGELPEAELIAHPECKLSVLERANFVGSTKKLLQHIQTSKIKTFVVATEISLLHTMQKAAPDKKLVQAKGGDAQHSTDKNGICSYMKQNTLEKIYLCLKNKAPEIVLDETERKAALEPILRMTAIG